MVTRGQVKDRFKYLNLLVCWHRFIRIDEEKECVKVLLALLDKLLLQIALIFIFERDVLRDKSVALGDQFNILSVLICGFNEMVVAYDETLKALRNLYLVFVLIVLRSWDLKQVRLESSNLIRQLDGVFTGLVDGFGSIFDKLPYFVLLGTLGLRFFPEI